MSYHGTMNMPANVPVIAVLLGCLGACAAPSAPSQLVARSSFTQPQLRTLARETTIKLDSGYFGTLEAGSTWEVLGVIPDGEVYRPVKDMLTLEAANIREAYLIVRSDLLVGFYSPADRSVSVMQAPVPLIFRPAPAASGSAAIPASK
jgi:hypothetical protein